MVGLGLPPGFDERSCSKLVRSGVDRAAVFAHAELFDAANALRCAVSSRSSAIRACVYKASPPTTSATSKPSESGGINRDAAFNAPGIASGGDDLFCVR